MPKPVRTGKGKPFLPFRRIKRGRPTRFDDGTLGHGLPRPGRRYPQPDGGKSEESKPSRVPRS